MKQLYQIALDIIALTPEELAREQLMDKLPAVAVLVIGFALVVAALIRMRKR